MLSEEDKLLIKALLDAGHTVRQIVADFPERGFRVRTVYDLAKKIRETGSTNRRGGSGRRSTVNTEVSEYSPEYN